MRNAILKGNRGSGIRLAQAGLRVEHSIIEENEEAGIRHDPAVPSHRQRELAGWFTAQTPTSTLFAQEAAPYRTLLIPSTYTDINIEQNEFKVNLFIINYLVNNLEQRHRCQHGVHSPISGYNAERIIKYICISIESALLE